jgi:hypothetical protein
MTELVEGQKVGDLVDECIQESIGVEIPVHGDPVVLPIHGISIITEDGASGTGYR